MRKMLAVGIIEPSNSFLSSPDLSVRKEDGGCSCVDYRALNRITVPDNFSIPMIDELLDELNVNFSRAQNRMHKYTLIQVEADAIYSWGFGLLDATT